MVKITYDLNNKKEVDMIENYYWLKYQFEVIESDILNNSDLKHDLKLFFDRSFDKEEYKTQYNMDEVEFETKLNEEQERIKKNISSFYNESDLIMVADILNRLFCVNHNYMFYLSNFGGNEYLGTETTIKMYKRILLNKFGDEKYRRKIFRN